MKLLFLKESYPLPPLIFLYLYEPATSYDRVCTNAWWWAQRNINDSLTAPPFFSSWWVGIYFEQLHNDVHKWYQWFSHTTSLTVFLVGRKIRPCFLPSFPQSHLSAWYIVGARYIVLLPTTRLNLLPHSPICQILCVAFLRNNSKDPVLEVLKDFPPTPGWTPPIHPPTIRRNE